MKYLSLFPVEWKESNIINPRRTCAARVTVVVPCLCVYSKCVSVSVRSFLPPRTSRPRNNYSYVRVHRDTKTFIILIFAKNQDYNFFPCRGEPIRNYISGSRCAWWQKTSNRHTNTLRIDTQTRDNYSNPCCACAPRVNYVELLPFATNYT